jgi:two-component system chemotaxis sensor kinase CheA
MTLEDNSKYIDLFIEESQEHIMTMNQLLLQLEGSGFDKDIIRQLYGLVHTIKGTAGVLGIDPICNLAHTMEDLLDEFQSKVETMDKVTLELLFKSSDLIESMLKELSEKKSVKSDPTVLIKELNAIMDKNTVNNENENKISKNNTPNDRLTLNPEQKELVMESLAENRNVYELDLTIEDDLKFKAGRIFQFEKALSTDGYVIATVPEFEAIDDDLTEIKILFATDKDIDYLAEKAISIKGINNIDFNPLNVTERFGIEQDSKITKENLEETKDKKQSQFSKAETIRIKSNLLDQLLDLVGEIMISNIRINQISTDLKHRELKQVLKNAERLIGELQDTVLRMRMVPVDHIFRRFPRMVRDKAKEENKNVDFQIYGHDIEIDRSLLDGIGDSLVHLLRNAVDHGIEPEEERVEGGKDSKGSITLSAFREQSSIVIELEDDGRGMNLDNLVNKAQQKGIITETEKKSMANKDKIQLAFLPGISTASQVSDISGRGIGLDTVKSKIELLGGTVKLDTKSGEGTKFTIKLPPSMSIISAMLVEVNQEKYAIPLENVCETTKLPATDIHEVAKSGMFQLRDEILPIFNIHTEFGGGFINVAQELPVIIVEKDDNRAGLVVTRFIGQQEIVVKNLSRDLRSTQYFSGATILGDGNVAMILDVSSLIN